MVWSGAVVLTLENDEEVRKFNYMKKEEGFYFSLYINDGLFFIHFTSWVLIYDNLECKGPSLLMQVFLALNLPMTFFINLMFREPFCAFIREQEE